MYEVKLFNESDRLVACKQSENCLQLFKFVQARAAKMFEFPEILNMYVADAVEQIPAISRYNKSIINHIVDQYHTAERKEDNSEELCQVDCRMVYTINRLIVDKSVALDLLRKLDDLDFGLEFTRKSKPYLLEGKHKNFKQF